MGTNPICAGEIIVCRPLTCTEPAKLFWKLKIILPMEQLVPRTFASVPGGQGTVCVKPGSTQMKARESNRACRLKFSIRLSPRGQMARNLPTRHRMRQLGVSPLRYSEKTGCSVTSQFVSQRG